MDEEFEKVLLTLHGELVKLFDVASFLDDVFNAGINNDQRLYSKLSKKYLSIVDKKIVEIAVRIGINRVFGELSMAQIETEKSILFSLAKIRQQIETHYWRLARIAKRGAMENKEE